MQTPMAMLKQVWNDNSPVPLDAAFVVDERLPALIASSQHLTLEEKTAGLKCWRENVVAYVNDVLRLYQLRIEHAQAQVDADGLL